MLTDLEVAYQLVYLHLLEIEMALNIDDIISYSKTS